VVEPKRPGPVFTVEEAAEQLRMARATLYRLVKEMKVPHRKIHGTGVRFTQADIDKILADALREAAA
jgi:excisionase family DNA binding protein